MFPEELNQNEDKVVGVIQYKMNLINYTLFKSNHINKEILDNICNLFATRILTLSNENSTDAIWFLFS